SNDPWTALGPWRAGGSSSARVVLRVDDDERVITSDGRTPAAGVAVRDGGQWYVWLDGVAYEFAIGIAPRRIDGAAQGRLDSPLPGQVVAVRVHAGQHVEEGDELVVVEAMKM